MGKRVLLFLVTNLAIVATLSIVFSLLGVAGYIDPEQGLLLVPLAIFCLFWGMGGAFISLLISRWTAKRLMGVRTLDGHTGNARLDWLHATVTRLAHDANLPAPEVGIYDSPEVNAFATGPSQRRSLVAVSSGLLERMGPSEIEGVLAHEIAHIANGDMVTMTLLQGVVNAVVMFVARVIGFAVRQAVDSRWAGLAQFVVVMVLQIALGLLGSLVVAWFSRQREFRADAGGAALAGRSKMVAALRNLMAQTELVDPSTPQLASFKIAGAPRFLQLLSTHPPLAERIALLERGPLA